MSDKLIIDCVSNQTIELAFTQEEIEQRESQRIAWETEQAKPKPPTAEERLSAIEDLLITII